MSSKYKTDWVPDKSYLMVQFGTKQKDLMMEVDIKELQDWIFSITGVRMKFNEDANPIRRWWVRFNFFMDIKDYYPVKYDIANMVEWLKFCKWIRTQGYANKWKWKDVLSRKDKRLLFESKIYRQGR